MHDNHIPSLPQNNLTMSSFSDSFRSSRQATIAQLYELADQFETGNRRGMKGRMAGAAAAIGGVTTAVAVGAMTGGGAIPATLAAEALMGANVVINLGAFVGGGFSLGQARKNRKRRRAVEDLLKMEREEMEQLRKELQPNLVDNLDGHITRIDVLYTMYTLGALGMSIPAGQISQNAATIHAIMGTAPGVPLPEIETDMALGILQGFDIPALRPTFEAISVPGADSCAEAFGDMVFHSLVDFASIAMLPFTAVILGIEARRYHRQDFKKAADVVRKIAQNMQEAGDDMEKLQKQVSKDLGQRSR